MEKKDLKYAKAYWWNIIKTSGKKSFNIFLAIATFIGIITLIVSQALIPPESELRNVVMNWSWQIPLAVFVIAFSIQIFWQPPSLFKEKSDKVADYEREEIDLVAENNEQYSRYETRRNIWVCRIGVKVLGQKTIRGITVYLKAYDGNENTLADAPLCPAERLRNVSGAISADPGNVQRFVEILQWNPGTDKWNIPYNLNYQLEQLNVHPVTCPYSLPTPIGSEKKHTLTLYATGENMKAVEREFSVEVKDEQLIFCRLNNERQQG